jgi:hypothetical protein
MIFRFMEEPRQFLKQANHKRQDFLIIEKPSKPVIKEEHHIQDFGDYVGVDGLLAEVVEIGEGVALSEDYLGLARAFRFVDLE